MAFEIKPNTGSMFNNERKEKDSHPDRTGKALIECPHCGKSWMSWLNGWVKKKDGKTWLSLSFKPQEDDRRSGGGGGGGRGRDAFEEERRGGQRSAGPNVGGSWRDKPGRDEDIPF